MEAEDPQRLADQLDQESDRLAQESDRLGHKIDDVRSDWRAKQNSDSVPGAVKPPEEGSEPADAGATAEDESEPADAGATAENEDAPAPG